jgi:5-methylthioadenosine/S-adenosylhomocysteine deaminase
MTSDRMIIRGGRPLDAASRTAAFVDILLIDSAIAAVGVPGMEAPSEAEVFDAAGTLMHAGLVNCHTHGNTNFAKGAHDRWTLELLLNGSGEWAENQTLEDNKYLNAYLGAIEMITKGCTVCYNLTFGFPLASVEEMNAIGQAYIDAGIRAVIAPMLMDISFYNAIPGLFDALPAHLQAELAASEMAASDVVLSHVKRALHNWPHDRELVRMGVAPTIPLFCSNELIVGCARVAREYGAVIQSHVAESKVQAVCALKRWGKSLTAHIDELGILGPDFTVAHGVWLDDDDMRRLADNGSSVAHNAGSNMRLGCGIADARRMIELGVGLAIGTDGAMCSDNQNMYEAMRCASMVSNVRGPDFRRWLTTPEIIFAATEGGARATGFDKIGKLAPAYRADIVFVDLASVNWMPLNDAANQIVLTGDGVGVFHVMVDGRPIVRNRRHVSCDMSALATKVEATRGRLTERNASIRAAAEAFEDVVGNFCIGLSRHPHPVDRFGASRHH